MYQFQINLRNVNKKSSTKIAPIALLFVSVIKQSIDSMWYLYFIVPLSFSFSNNKFVFIKVRPILFVKFAVSGIQGESKNSRD